MFPGWLQVFFRMIISNERSKGTRWSPTIRWSALFDDPQPFDDPQLFNDQLEVWTLIIQKSTVILPSLMVLFFYSHLSTWFSLYLSCSFIPICQHDCHCICLVLCLGWGWMRPVTSRALFCPLLGLRLELPLKPIVAPRLNSPATHSMVSSHVWWVSST